MRFFKPRHTVQSVAKTLADGLRDKSVVASQYEFDNSCFVEGTMIELATTKPELPPFHIVVDFGNGVPSDMQAKAMFDMEKSLREKGVPAEVFKRTAPDDSKLRRSMTSEERKRL